MCSTPSLSLLPDPLCSAITVTVLKLLVLDTNTLKHINTYKSLLLEEFIMLVSNNYNDLTICKLFLLKIVNGTYNF